MAVRRPRPRWMDSSSRGTSITRMAPNERQQRDPAEKAHQCTVTFCLTEVLVPQLGSLTSTRMV